MICIIVSVVSLVGGGLSADEKRARTSRATNLPSPTQLARQKLAKEVLCQQDLPEVLLKAKANVRYRHISKPDLPNFLDHKNTVETNRESSLIQVVYTYVQATGDDFILSVTVDGLTVSTRMGLALEYLLNVRFPEKHGLLWGATTADRGDVQNERFGFANKTT